VNTGPIEDTSLLPGVTQKPWGHERIIQKNDLYVVKELYVKPNSRLSLQYHNKKVETMFLVGGEGYLEFLIDGREDYSNQKMRPMFPYFISPGATHRLYTEGSDCLVVEVSSTELNDVVRIEDDYGRLT
jgi:mannose-6-phosphate isomerase